MNTQPSEAAMRAAKAVCNEEIGEYISNEARDRHAARIAKVIDRETHAKELAEALADALPLTVAWVAHYEHSPAYGGGNKHPEHTAILAKITRALAKFKEAK